MVGRQLSSDSEHEHSYEGLDRIMGMSLVLGFIFMMFVEQLATYMSNSGGSRNSTTDAEALVQSSGHSGRKRHNGAFNWTTTLGLVVHAAADGIALGAAAATNQLDVEFIVFLAIMLHKAPAAFGLVTFLLHEGLDRNRARKHLLIFSISAPALALITFIGLSSGSSAMVRVNFCQFITSCTHFPLFSRSTRSKRLELPCYLVLERSFTLRLCMFFQR